MEFLENSLTPFQYNVQFLSRQVCLDVSELFLNCVGSFAADGFVVQTGDPEGPAEGFIDPSTGKIRTVPLEIMVDGDKAPVYGETLEVSRSSLIFFVFSFYQC
jgi:hypothetical protein